jgi:hypothetical protein
MFYDIYLYTLCYYICCLLGACMRCTRLCSLKPGVTLLTGFYLPLGGSSRHHFELLDSNETSGSDTN